MKTWLLLLTAVLLMSFSGCERENDMKPADIDALTGKWQLIEPGMYKVTLIIEPIAQNDMMLPLRIRALSGESAVNLYNTSLTYKAQDQSEITIDSISSTKRGGSAEAMQFEQTYYTNLKAVNRYELTDKSRLRFYYDGGVLVYEKIK